MPSTLKDTPTVVSDAPTTDLAVVVRELAARPEVDVAKLEKIIELQERILRHEAESAFNSAFAEMQAALPTVPERGRSVNGPYATFEDIVETVRPVLQHYGFGLTHRTEFPGDEVRVVGVLTHRSGHSIASEFRSQPDTSGNKNAIQALGSAVSYGRRYTAAALLLIATRGDDDGHATSAPPQPEPEGFDTWWKALQAVADNGHAELEAAWSHSDKTFKRYLTTVRRRDWDALKAKAATVRR